MPPWETAMFIHALDRDLLVSANKFVNNRIGNERRRGKEREREFNKIVQLEILIMPILDY